MLNYLFLGGYVYFELSFSFEVVASADYLSLGKEIWFWALI